MQPGLRLSPLQPVPLDPQGPPVSVHSVSGSVPALTGAQVPSDEPVLLWTHAWHCPLHGVLQQTLSTQLPDWHSEPRLHGWPLGRGGTQLPPWQTKPGAQGSKLLQLEAQLVPAALQPNGAHGKPGPGLHWPLPLHWLGALCTALAQNPGWHWVPPG